VEALRLRRMRVQNEISLTKKREADGTEDLEALREELLKLSKQIEEIERCAGLVGDLTADEAEGLLQRRAVRVSIAIGLALWYVKEFPIKGSTRKFQPGDSRDLQHVLSAAATGTDIFVTQDDRLRRAMELISEDLFPLQVTDLDGLIAQISPRLFSKG
jgi:hypothetical protein